MTDAASQASPSAGTHAVPGVRPWLGWIAAASGAVLLLAAAHLAAPHLSVPPLASFAIGFAAVSASALATAWRCPARGLRAAPWAAAPAGVLLFLSLNPLPELAMAAMVTVCLLLMGTLIGGAVGAAIEHPGHLSLVALVSAAADVFSVFHPSGPSAAIVQSEVALSVLALPWPMLGTEAIEPLLGAGDVVFTALYVASARRHTLPSGRTLLALTVGFGVTMVFVIFLQVAVPALPFLGLAMVAAHRQVRRPPERDRIRGFVIAAVVVAAVAASLLI